VRATKLRVTKVVPNYPPIPTELLTIVLDELEAEHLNSILLHAKTPLGCCEVFAGELRAAIRDA
jgi:hypothetical protein